MNRTMSRAREILLERSRSVTTMSFSSSLSLSLDLSRERKLSPFSFLPRTGSSLYIFGRLNVLATIRPHGEKGKWQNPRRIALFPLIALPRACSFNVQFIVAAFPATMFLATHLGGKKGGGNAHVESSSPHTYVLRKHSARQHRRIEGRFSCLCHCCLPPPSLSLSGCPLCKEGIKEKAALLSSSSEASS